MPEVNDFISIGKIVRPIGVKGNVKVIYLTDFPDRFKDLEKIFLYDEEKKSFVNKNSDFEFAISECRTLNDYVNLKFMDFDDKDSVKELINKIIMLPESERVELPEDSFYFFELVGAEVFDKGKRLGIIKSFSDFGSGDLINISYEGKDIMIPLRKEFVKEIDIKNKKVELDLIEGFLE